MYFSGTFTRIENLQFWKSTGAYVTGETIKWTGEKTAYVAPTTTVSIYADTSVPTADPGTANVSIGGTLSGSLSSTTAGNPGYSDYMVLQMSITTAASGGVVNQKTFTFQFDEI